MQILHRFTLVTLALAFSFSAGAQEPLLVVGHTHPDTDSICSAIAVAHLKNAQGIPALAIRQGAVPAETRFVLDYFKIIEPPLMTRVAGRQVFQVDHTDYSQAPADLRQAELTGFVDHHKLGGLISDKPVEVWAAPVGATGTLVARMYDFAGVAIPAPMAGCLLATILSDTVVFKSATTTPLDKVTAERLAKLAGVSDPGAFGRKMQEAKADIRGETPAALLNRDLKTFDMYGKKVGVGQLEVLDLATLTPLKADLLQAMQAIKKEGYHSVFLMLTDTTQQATDLLFVSDDPAAVRAAWGIDPQGSSVWLPGVMSRKSQIIPALLKAFK